MFYENLCRIKSSGNREGSVFLKKKIPITDLYYHSRFDSSPIKHIVLVMEKIYFRW